MRDLLRDLVYLFSGEWARGMFSRPYISAQKRRLQSAWKRLLAA